MMIYGTLIWPTVRDVNTIKNPPNLPQLGSGPRFLADIQGPLWLLLLWLLVAAG